MADLSRYNDTQRKEVGDRITVLDFSSLSHVDGTMLESLDYDKFIEGSKMTKRKMIVIKTGQRAEFESFTCTYKQDLVIVDMLDKKQYRIASRHVKLFN